MLSQQLPRDILDRVGRVLDYHRASKLSPESVRANPPVLDLAIKPSPYRRFGDAPRVGLPTKLLDAPVSMLAILSDGLGAVPESQLQPPQDLKTLATWLYFANGIVQQKSAKPAVLPPRTCPSSGGLYPFEIYVAAFAIEGLEPGLYHYSIKEFALRKLREGGIALAQIKRGRPDLNFLKSVPAALLVSTIFWRSAWRYRQRGYRMALLDAGHLVQNIVAAANSLGIQTMPRLQNNDNTMRELIGVPSSADFGAAEAVQTMVVWADNASRPAPDVPGPVTRDELPSIPRQPLSPQHVPYGSVVATHMDCVAPGMPLREIRPPFTELSPVAPEHLTIDLQPDRQPEIASAARHVLLSRRSMRAFGRHALSRDQFLLINRLSFRGGSVFPMLPDGPHVALLRPYWIVNAVAGMEAGLWYYDPRTDRWALQRRGEFRADAAYLSVEQPHCGNASAVCFLMSDLRSLMAGAGPDAYRLAHVEAGIMGQRLNLAATALAAASCGIGAFYDDAVRDFLGVSETGWEPLYAMALGVPESPARP
jgi:SagB-type dehydrogenase family enzyme